MKTKFPDAAWELVKFLMSDVHVKAMIRLSFLQPARMSMLPHFYDLVRRSFAAVEEYDVDLWVYGEPWDLGIGHTFQIWQKHAEADEILNPMIEKVFMVGDTPVSAFKEVCREIEALHGL